MTADSKCGFYVIYYQRMRWLLIVPRFQEPQNLKNSGCRGWTDFSRSWVLRGAVPLIRSAVWRSRTSKSFPTDWLATRSNTIMGIRHTGWMNRHSITHLTQKNTSHIQSKQGGLNHSSKQHTWRNWWRWSRTTRIRRHLIYSQNRYLYGISTNAEDAFLLNCHLP